MKKQFLIFAILLGSLLSVSAQITGDGGMGGDECPDRCSNFSIEIVCCKTPGGSTYYGQII